MARKYGLFINGQYIHSSHWNRVPNALNPDETLGEVAQFRKDDDDSEIWEACLEGAWQTYLQVRNENFFPFEERLAFLKRLSTRFEDQKENLAQLIMQEVGKPLALARGEVGRAIDTLLWTIEAAPKIINREERLPLHQRDSWKDFEGYWTREARGPLLAITPFNFPLNLAIHKIAPALAAGCPVILKPSGKASLVGLCIADYCQAESLPAGMLNVFNCDNATTEALIADSRVRHVSFTGSAKVGWKLRNSTQKPFFLELGGAAPVFVDEGCDLQSVATNLCKSSFAYAGQVCISTQSIWIHENIYSEFVKAFEKAMNTLPCGLAAREDVICSSLITEESFQRVKDLEAQILCEGGKITQFTGKLLETGSINAVLFEKSGWQKQFLAPRFIEDLQATSTFLREEAFAPLVALQKATSFETFVEWSNALESRLQCAVFSSNETMLKRAAHELDYGGVILNESPSHRFDPMPYGGRGRAGSGSEGPKFALQDYTELKSVLKKT